MSIRNPGLTLDTAQRWFLGVITHPDSVAGGLESEANRIPPADLERVVRKTQAASALERLEIYHSSYLSRLEECLADDYSAVKFALGDAAFQALCHAYVKEHPSRHPSLNQFGSRLPEFALERVAEVGPFLVELARLEWALVEVVHARSTEGFTVPDLARLPPDALGEVRFEPSAAARLLAFEYPANDYLQAYLDDREPEIPGPSPSSLLVVRRGTRNRRIQLESVQAAVLGRLLSGDSLGSALFGVTSDQAAVGDWFRSWTEYGVFAGVRLGRG